MCEKERERALSTILFPCQQEWTDETEDKGEATYTLNVMVAAVPIERAADLGTETQSNLQVSAGRAEQSTSIWTLKDQSMDFKRPVYGL